MEKEEKTIALEGIEELTKRLLARKICLYEIALFFTTIGNYHEAKDNLGDSVKGSIAEKFYKKRFENFRKYVEEDLKRYDLGFTIDEIDKMDIVWR